MPVFHWGPGWNTFRDLEQEFDRLMNNVNLTMHGVQLRQQYPAVNLHELEEEFLLTAELPGTRADELEVTLTNSTLTIKGQRGDASRVPENNYRRRERFHGAWQRSLTVPDRVKEDELSAEFSNGVLKIHLPKAEEIRPRQIPVADGDAPPSENPGGE